MTKTWAQLLSAAILIAATAHKDAIDKNGRPYILHPMWVMSTLLARGEDDYTAALGIMHDVKEDCPDYITDDELLFIGFSQRFIDDIDLLTHNKGESYADYIMRASGRKCTRTVKMVDIEHNSNIIRSSGCDKKDLDRISKYFKAHAVLAAIN